jgi:predicted DsbA family dithiol-disulfide isomerase
MVPGARAGSASRAARREPRAVTVSVDIYSDVVCPWCYLGKRRFAAALAARPGLAVDVRWRPFELNPELPAAGVDRREYLARKFGAGPGIAEAHARLAALGAEAGIAYRFEAITRMPNTRLAHALIAIAGAKQDAVVEGLFRAYFEEARDVGDPAVLAAIGAQAGLDGATLPARLTGGDGRDAVVAAEEEAARLGIHGVPFFVFAGRWAVSGAQEPASFVAALDQVAAELARESAAPSGGIAETKR